MLDKPSLSEKIIMFLAEMGDATDYPKSFNQLLNWDKEKYYREKERLKAQERRYRKRIQRALKNLEAAEMLNYNQSAKKYELTPAGWIRYLYYFSKKQTTKKKQNKDDKYIIVFDIPEVQRRFRDLFRQCLVNRHARFVQKSVFICPDKEVFDWAKKITANCHLDGHVKFIEAKKIY
jgi:DNA-binding transcriptional regulator PaaX